MIPAKPLKHPSVRTAPGPEEEEEENEDEEEGQPAPVPAEETPRPRKAQWVSDGPHKREKRLVGMVSVPFVRLRTKTSTDSLLEGVGDSMKGHYVKKTHTRDDSPPPPRPPRRQSSSSTPPSSKLLIFASLMFLCCCCCCCCSSELLCYFTYSVSLL